MKTAIATSPGRCRHCNREATQLLVWQMNPKGELKEAELCSEHFGDMVSILNLDEWEWENL